MATTPEQQTASVVNTIIALVAQLAGIQDQITSVSNLWTNIGAANKLNQFPTCSLTPTGGLGAADGNPNTANPINTGGAPGALISRPVSANQIASMLTYLQGVQSVINGNAVLANGAAPQLLALCQ